MVAGTIVEAIKETFSLIWYKASEYPVFALILDYIRRSYQNDPARVAIEVLLLFFALKYLTMMKGSRGRAGGQPKLSEREIDELVEDWEPEPLASTNIDSKNKVKQLTDQCCEDGSVITG